MKKFAFLFFLAFTFCSVSVKSQTDWFEQTAPTATDLYDIEFVNYNVGYAVGVGGRIIKTTNGGYSWVELNSGTTQTLFDCQFETELQGWACGGGGLVLRTTNGGTTWTPHVILTANEFHAIHFFSSTSGYVAGKNTSTGQAEIYYTINGGASFTGISPPSGMTDIRDVVFANLNVGLVLDSWSVYYTTNGGTTWDASTYASTFAVNRIEMFSATSGWMVGEGGSIFFSSTGGGFWNPQTSPVTTALYGLSVVDANNVFACGQGGLIISTTNAGLTWTQHTPIVTTNLKSMSAVDASNVWAAGIASNIVRTKTDIDLEVQSYSGPSTVCTGQPFLVSVNVKNGSTYTIGSGTFTVLDGIDPVITYDLVTPLLAGQTLTLDLGYHSISANALLTINFTGDDITGNNSAIAPINLYTSNAYGVTGPSSACVGETISMQAFGGTNYYWMNAGADSSAQNQVLVFTESKGYIVKITQDNCVFVDTLSVAVASGDCATSVFTPNGDGKNDFFYIENLPVGDNTVTIYNRWGDEIAIIYNYDNSSSYWNGDDTQNNAVVEGTYFYVVEGKSTGPFSKGWVQVLK